MGLDMYLKRKIFVGANYEHTKTTGAIDIIQDGKTLNIPLKKVSEIILHEGDWRKANAIHKWFVDNVQDGKDDCGEYYVNTDKLKQLLDICRQVKANPEKAPELLPTTDGFFFGSVKYDEWYFRNITETILIIEEVLKVEEGDIYYTSCW